MSAEKARFKRRLIIRGDLRAFAYRKGDELLSELLPLRVTDARDLTAEKAVEKVLQQWAEGKKTSMRDLAGAACMTARVVNGKVKVRRANKG